MTAPRIAVFGAGLIGKRHIEQARTQAELCAIVDPSGTARTLAEDLGVPYFATPADCLAVQKPDGAVIATPNHLHAEHAILCINAGVPVLIEKPLADTNENADRIVQAAAATGTPVLVGHHRRHNPIIKRAHDEIQAGRIGQIMAVNGQFWLYKPDDYFDATWRKGPGAGPVMINMIHDIDLLRHLCGDITEVQAMRAAARRGGLVEDTAAVIMRFVNGALGTFSLSDTVVAPWSWEMMSGENPIYPHKGGSCYTIGGTQASLSIPDLHIWSHDGPRSWRNDINPTDISIAPTDAFAVQFTHFLDVIKGAHSLVSAHEGRESLRVVLKIIDAALPDQPKATP